MTDEGGRRFVKRIIAVGGALAITTVGLLALTRPGSDHQRTSLVAVAAPGTKTQSSKPLAIKRFLLAASTALPSQAPVPPGGLDQAPTAQTRVLNGPVSTGLQNSARPFIPYSLTNSDRVDVVVPCGHDASADFSDSAGDLVSITKECLTQPVNASLFAPSGSGVEVADEGSDQVMTSAVAPVVPGVGSFFSVARSNSSGEVVDILVSGGNGRAAPMNESAALNLARALLP